jgi:hypothetical protein
MWRGSRKGSKPSPSAFHTADEVKSLAAAVCRGGLSHDAVL